MTKLQKINKIADYLLKRGKLTERNVGYKPKGLYGVTDDCVSGLELVTVAQTAEGYANIKFELKNIAEEILRLIEDK